MLIVNTRFDPGTPYANALAVERLLPSSRLLTLDGWGHTTLLESSCIYRAVERYLIGGTLPAAGATCTPDRKPFDPRSASAAARRVVASESRGASSLRP